MKKLLAIALLLLAVPAFAADYTVTLNAGQETTITRARTESNTAACALVGLPASCTQAQANAAVVAAAAEVPPRVLPSVNIFNGNNSYVNSLVNADLARMKAVHKAADKNSFDSARDTATQAQKDAACVALGLVAGCL